MIEYKSDEEIQIMHEGGKRLHAVVQELLPKVTVGKTTNEIDAEAERLLIAHGGAPSFKTVKGYDWSICIPVNEQVVHTPPSDRVLTDGDIVTLDIGILYKGFHTDWATTVIVGKPKDESHVHFLETGKQTLQKALEKAVVGNFIGDISKVIEDGIYSEGYHILEELTGHGIGTELHMDPYVPGFLSKPVEKTLKMKPGLVLAVEVIYSMGTEEIAYEKGNDWSVITKDKSLSACFEETVALTDKKSFILT